MDLKGIQKTIEKIGTSLPPNDDWLPTLIMEGKKPTIIGFAGDAMKNNGVKDIVAGHMTELIAENDPDVVYWITSAWALMQDAKGVSELDMELYRMGAIKLSEHKHRVEIVNAYCYGEKPKLREAFMIGRIQRNKNRPPTISKWKIIEGEGLTSEGRFPEAIRRGFKQAKGGKDKT